MFGILVIAGKFNIELKDQPKGWFLGEYREKARVQRGRKERKGLGRGI